MGRLETRLEQAADASEGERIVVLRCPLAMADKLKGRMSNRPGPVLLITTDLEDPLPEFRQTRPGRKFADHPLRWRSIAELAATDARVRKALKGEGKAMRRFLPTASAKTSPRLAPALALLIPALAGLRQNKDNWTLRSRGELLATLYAFNHATHEGLQLRLTDPGLTRWPALEPQQRARGKYPVTWTLRPEEVPELVLAMTGPPGTRIEV